MTRKYLYFSLGLTLIVIAIFYTLNAQRKPTLNEIYDVNNHIPKRTSRQDASEIQSKRNVENERKRRLAEIANKKTEAQREAGILGKKDAPNYLLLGDNGKITQQALRDSGISTTEASAIQDIFDKKWHEVSAALSKTVSIDRNTSDFEKGIYAYNIPALPDGGAESISEIEKNVEKVVGSEIGEKLIRSFDPNQYLCGFGKYDVNVVFYPTSQNGVSDLQTVEYTFTYPASSQVVRRGEVTSDKVYTLFGLVFENLKEQN